RRALPHRRAVDLRRRRADEPIDQRAGGARAHEPLRDAVRPRRRPARRAACRRADRHRHPVPHARGHRDVPAAALRQAARARRVPHQRHRTGARARAGAGRGLRQDRDVTAPELDTRAAIRWPAVIRGALLGLALIIPITIVGALLARGITDFEDSGWRVLLALLIALAFVPAGAYAARAARRAALTNGALGVRGALGARL